MERTILQDPIYHTRHFRWMGFTTFVEGRSGGGGRRLPSILSVINSAIRGQNGPTGRELLASQVFGPSVIGKLISR